MTDDETSTGVIVTARSQLSDCEVCVRSAHFALVRSAGVPVAHGYGQAMDRLA